MQSNWESKQFMKKADTYKLRGMWGSGQHRKNVTSSFCVSTRTPVGSYRRRRLLKSSYFFPLKLTCSHDSSWNHVLSLRSASSKVVSVEESVRAHVQSLFSNISRSWHLVFCHLLRKDKHRAFISSIWEDSIYSSYIFTHPQKLLITRSRDSWPRFSWKLEPILYFRARIRLEKTYRN